MVPRKLLGGSVFALCLLAPTPWAGEPTAWSIDNFEPGTLYTIDVTTANSVGSVPLNLAGDTDLGGNGLAWDPLTQQLYAVVRFPTVTGRQLVLVDPTTGNLTSVGNSGVKLAGIAFDCQGRLWGVTGDGAVPSETLVEISTVNASVSIRLALGDGNDGEALGSSPRTGLLYHASGLGTQNLDEIYESIDPWSLVIADVPLSGADFEEALGLGFNPSNGQLLLVDLDSNLFQVTTGGVVSLIGGLDHTSKGIAMPYTCAAVEPVPIVPPLGWVAMALLLIGAGAGGLYRGSRGAAHARARPAAFER
jgi:hypothetical protein